MYLCLVILAQYILTIYFATDETHTCTHTHTRTHTHTHVHVRRCWERPMKRKRGGRAQVCVGAGGEGVKRGRRATHTHTHKIGRAHV